MKALITLLILAWCAAGHGQDAPTFDPQPCFAAVIVTDLSASTEWYRKVLPALELKRQMEEPSMKMKVNILESKDFILELIQSDSALKRTDIAGYVAGSHDIRGFFKIGFRIGNMDPYVAYLKKQGVDFFGPIYTDRETGKRNFLMTDPDGNLVQIYE